MKRTRPHLRGAVRIAGTASLPAQNTIPGVTQLAGTARARRISAAPWPLAVAGSASIGNSLEPTPTMSVFTEGVIVGAARLDLPLRRLLGCACTLAPEPTLSEVGGPHSSPSQPTPNQIRTAGQDATKPWWVAEELRPARSRPRKPR